MKHDLVIFSKEIISMNFNSGENINTDCQMSMEKFGI